MRNFFLNLKLLDTKKQLFLISTLQIIFLFISNYSLFNNQAGYLDAWIYFSYINNFDDLIARYGLT